MKTRQIRMVALLIGAILVLPVAAAVLLPVVLDGSDRLDFPKIAAVAQQYPNFTVEQRAAVVHEMRAQMHPHWKDLPMTARIARSARIGIRLLRQLMSAPSMPPAASFVGNQTVILNPSGGMLGLQRQNDCSLTLYDGSYTLATSSMFPTLQFLQSSTHYEQVLHTEAGLTTTPDVFSGGCTDATLGTGARRGAYLGKTGSGDLFLAWAAFNSFHSANAVYSSTVNPASMVVQGSQADFSAASTTTIAVGDLNGDGLADVVGIESGTGEVYVWLANANGTLGTPTSYLLPGGASSTTEAAVVADVTSDGKPDVVVVTRANSNYQETVSILPGNGTGALGAAQSFAITTPTSATNTLALFGNFIAADLRGSHANDLVGANGLVLLNNGSGTFTPAASVALVPTVSTSNFGPNLTVGDFNKDGKLDLAMDDGIAVHLCFGNGDGTFTAGPSYASNTEVGYVTASDLDGDGNLDLYVGTANGGVYAGDQFDAGQSYALMGNGDGTLRGAPYVPFIYTGTNLVDLNGDGHIDAIGLNAARTFTSYLGDGKGNFTAKGTLPVASLSFSNAQNNPYPIQGIDSYGIADINGDGKPDLVFLAQGLTIRPLTGFDTGGVLLSLGDGAGNFAAPTFLPDGHFVPGNDIDVNPGLSNIRLADVNGDGRADLIFSYVDEDYTANPNVFYQGIAVQLGNGDGTFQAPQTLVLYNSTTTASTMPVPDVVAITDLNHDNKPDLILVAETTPAQNGNSPLFTLEVALGNGNGTFGAPTPVTTNDVVPLGLTYGTQSVALAAVDMNGDGIPDLVTLGSSSTGSAQIAIALGNGDGSFKTPNKTNLGLSYAQQGIAIGDFNGDGKLDVGVMGVFGPIDTGIVFGNGDGTLAPLNHSGSLEPNQLIYLTTGESAIGYDFNGDGKTDILAGNTILLQGAPGAASADFSVSASSTSGTIPAGQSAQTTLTLTPSGGFNQTVSLSCSGLPAGAACRFSNSALALNGSAATSVLTLSTTARSAQAQPAGAGRAPPPWLPAGGLMLAGLLAPLAARAASRESLGRTRLLMLALISAALMSGCGGGSSGTSGSGSSSGNGSSSGSSGSSSSGSSSGANTGTPAGTYPVTINAIGGGVTHTLQYALTVN